MQVFSPLKEENLIKGRENISSDTVVMIGNGALVNGWMPLRHVLDQWIQAHVDSHPVINKLRVQNSEAMHQLAGLSYKFKIARGSIYRQWQNGEMKPHQTATAGLGTSIEEFLSIREQVSQQYKKASGDLILNHDEEAKKFLGDDAVYITTNWDNALWLDENVKKAIYLHGRCDFSDSLVFPTELIIEDIAYDCDKLLELTRYCSAGFQSKILKTFRCSTVEALLSAHTIASR